MDRVAYLAWEESFLAPEATRSHPVTRRFREPDQAGDYRTAFQHDRDRIIHSLAFKRLKDKTQVFAPERSDHLRNRLAHTLEVTQLARTLARALRLNEDLVEAIALGHDLGHAPFGHSGEAVLNRILTGEIEIPGSDPEAFRAAGGFKHNYQSVRIVDTLEVRYAAFPGLNLTDPVREGILKHTGTRGRLFHDFVYEGLHIDAATTFPEAAVVAITDELAQQCHDLEDGIRLKTVGLDALLETPVADVERLREILKSGSGYTEMNRLIRALFSLFMDDLVHTGLSRRPDGGWMLTFSPPVQQVFEGLRKFVYTRIIFSREVARSDHVAETVITTLFTAFFREPKLLPDYVLGRIAQGTGEPRLRGLSGGEYKKCRARLQSCGTFVRAIADYIGGMTDSYAIREFHQIQP